MGRSSLRHSREIQGFDSAGETAGDHGEKANLPGTVYAPATATEALGPPTTVTIGGTDPVYGALPGSVDVDLTIDTDPEDNFSTPILSGQTPEAIAENVRATIDARVRYSATVDGNVVTITNDVGAAITAIVATVT